MDIYGWLPFHQEELLLRIRKLLELRRSLQRYYLGLAGSGAPPEETPEAAPVQETEDAFVQQLRELVEAHLMEIDHSVVQLCRDMAMSRSQLHRKLTALTGYSPNRFIRYVRLSRARRLLAETDTPVANIAYDTGFSDPGYFTRAFRKEFGRTPTEFREK